MLLSGQALLPCGRTRACWSMCLVSSTASTIPLACCPQPTSTSVGTTFVSQRASCTKNVGAQDLCMMKPETCDLRRPETVFEHHRSTLMQSRFSSGPPLDFQWAHMMEHVKRGLTLAHLANCFCLSRDFICSSITCIFHCEGAVWTPSEECLQPWRHCRPTPEETHSIRTRNYCRSMCDVEKSLL